VRQIICQPKEWIANFVCERMGEPAQNWGNYSALGLLDDSELIAGVIYNHYNKPSICMHVGALPGRRWATREFLFAVFDYPFNQLGCARITALVPKKNIRARKFDKNIGFRFEGRMRKTLSDGDDMMIYGLLKQDCRWLNRLRKS
jgi:RimJ/RimL family protein N-acetyltransferase